MEDYEYDRSRTRPPLAAIAPEPRWLALRVSVFFLAFMATTQAGYLFAFPPYAGIGVFWPSTGLCLAALLLEDRRAWPAYVLAIFVGEFLGVNLQGHPLPVGVVWGVAASGEPLLSALLLRPGGAPFTLSRLRDLVALVAVGAVASPAVAAMLAASASVAWLDSPSWAVSWSTWWFGDALGVLVSAPVLVVWLGGKRPRMTIRGGLLGSFLLVAMVLATQAMFGGAPGTAGFRMVPGFLAFPILLWMAARFELRGVAVATAIFNILAAYQTTRGRGFFAAVDGSPLERLVTLQAYLTSCTLSSLALGVALAERRRGARQLQDIIDNSTALIFAKGIDRRYLFINRQFERTARVPQARIVGRTVDELWPTRFAETSRSPDTEVLRTRRAVTVEKDLPFAEGERTFVAIHFPLCDDAGVPYAVGGISTDITDRKRAEEALQRSEDRLSLVVAASHDAIYDWDLESGVVWRNGYYRDVYGVVHGNIREWMSRLHPDDRLDVLASLEAAMDAHARTWSAEYRLTRRDGTFADVLDNACLPYDAEGLAARMVEAMRDISERRRAQEEIARSNVELEQRVQLRTSELATAYDEMAALTYSISHDLRRPLRAIDGFGSALLEDHAKALDPEATGLLFRIRAASCRMGQLIDDLLFLSRAGRAEVRHEKVDLGAIAATVLKHLREEEPARGVTAIVEEGLTAWGDPGLLRIALENLLANAWKFTSQHAEARIEVGRTREGDQVAFFVRDDGAGFDPRYAAKLFGPFERLHGTTEYPGEGIGLAITQRIVARHGGRIWATGGIERGATFYFTLPDGTLAGA